MVASRAYLVPDEQVATAAEAIMLITGRVVRVLGESPAPGGLVLAVELDLAFRGYAGAWHGGTNERFVTFTSRTGAVPLVLSLATSP
jgi:hypothetical protein